MIQLRNILQSDLEAVKEYVSDPLVARYLTWEAYTSEQEVQDFIDRAKVCVEFPNEFLAIVYDGVVVGTVHLIDRGNGNTQFGFGIVSRLWGNGIGPKVVQETLRHIQVSRWKDEARIVWADIHKDNVRAARVLEKTGFVREGFVDGVRIRYTKSV